MSFLRYLGVLAVAAVVASAGCGSATAPAAAGGAGGAGSGGGGGTGSTTDPNLPQDNALALSCETAVDALRSVLASAGGTPEHLMDSSEAVLDGTEFDVMEELSALPNVELEDGWILDYVYHWDGMGGYPMLYARPETMARFLSQADMQQAIQAGTVTAEQLAVPQRLRPDGTPESYLQVAAFLTMADHFYLVWHSLVRDHTVVCSRATLERAIGYMEGGFCQAADATTLDAAWHLDVNPTVTESADRVDIGYVVFTKWGGFLSNELALRTAAPHEILTQTDSTLVLFDCGVMY